MKEGGAKSVPSLMPINKGILAPIFSVSMDLLGSLLEKRRKK